MPEPGRDDVNRGAGEQQCGGVQVPQVVEPSVRYLPRIVRAGPSSVKGAPSAHLLSAENGNAYPGGHAGQARVSFKRRLNPAKTSGMRGAVVGLLPVSAETGGLGPVIVLAGDADDSSAMQLNEVLTAGVSGRTAQLTIDPTNLRFIDPATAQTLMLAALIVMVQGGSTVLVNPQEPVLKMLDHTRTAEMFTIQNQTPAGTAPDTSPATDRADETATHAND